MPASDIIRSFIQFHRGMGSYEINLSFEVYISGYKQLNVLDIHEFSPATRSVRMSIE
jgi:hypothetical protein